MKIRNMCTNFEYTIILELLKQSAGQLKEKGFNLQVITFKNRNDLLQKDDPLCPKGGHLDYIENGKNLFQYIFSNDGNIGKTQKSMFFLIQARLYKMDSETPLIYLTVEMQQSHILLFPGSKEYISTEKHREIYFSIPNDLKENDNFLDDLATFLSYVKELTITKD